MSNYNNQLQSNNTDLQSILDTINNLPNVSDIDAEQATPIISVSSNGLIIATAGTKSSTYQLTSQAATVIIPTTTNQIVVQPKTYVQGRIKVAAVVNAEEVCY